MCSSDLGGARGGRGSGLGRALMGELELREVGGAQAEGRDLSVPVHPVGGVSTRL